MTDNKNKAILELARQIIELAAEHTPDIPQQATKPEHKPDNAYRVGDNYSVFKWKRVDTGEYETKAANGLRLRVYNQGKGIWFAQVGNAVLNDNKPVSTKVEAIGLAEDVLIST